MPKVPNMPIRSELLVTLFETRVMEVPNPHSPVSVLILKKAKLIQLLKPRNRKVGAIQRRGGRACNSTGGSEVSNKGFTLIEILVAISILAISLVVILQLFSGGLRSNKLSDEYTRGIFHAREKMEEILLSKEFTEGLLEGVFDDEVRWKTEIVRIEQAEEEESMLPYNMFNIKVEVMWDEGDRERHFQISTIKLAEKTEGDKRS